MYAPRFEDFENLNLKTIFSEEFVVIGGAVRAFGDHYLSVVRVFLSVVQPTVPPRLVWTKRHNKVVLYGAIGDALEYVFDRIAGQSKGE